MPFKRILLHICLWLLFPSWSAAQTIWTEEFPFAAELPSNEMTCIHQDRDGFIWTGTTNGLARYDGYRLQTFQANRHDPSRLTNNHITCLAEDSLRLWVGTAHGLTLIDKQTYRTDLPEADVLRNTRIRALCTDGQNTVWAATDHQILRFHLSPHPQDTLFIPPNGDSYNHINSLFYDPPTKTLWICATQGIFTWSARERHLRELPADGQPANPTSLFRDRDGHYWFGTWGQGLWQLIPDENGRNARYVRQDIPPAQGKNAEGRFFSLTQDNKSGYLWALSYNRLYAFRHDKSTEKLISVNLPPHVDTGKMYTQLLRDRDGNLWASSYDGGTLLTFHTETLHNYPLSEIHPVLGGTPNLLTLDRDSQGRFWFVQDRFGLCLYDPANGMTHFAAPDVQRLTVDARVTTYSPSSGGLWVADPHDSHVRLFSYGHGTFKVSHTFRLTTGIPASQMEETPDGKLYLRCGHRVFCYDAHSLRLLSATPDSLPISCLSADTHGTVWGATDRHIYRIREEEGHLSGLRQKPEFQIPEKETIRFLQTDGMHGFWVATNLGRILHATQGQAGFQDFSDRFDTQGRTVLNLLCQGQDLWLVSHNRIVHYDIRNQYSRPYAPADGNMAPSIFRDQAACLSPDGTLHAGGRGGIVSITPPAFSMSPGQPHPVILTDIRSGMESLLFSPSPRYTQGTPNRHAVTLRPEAANLAVSFSTLDYGGGARTRYAYRLGGIDKDWNYLPEGENTAYYQNLPKGKYRLFVKATDAHGKWQAPVALLDLTRLPAWYETLWAYMAYAAAILLVGGMLLRFYLGRLHSQNRLRLQEELTQAKLDYFTNISHDLLTPLGVISCVGDYWEQRHPEEREQTDVLHHNIARLKRLLGQALDFRKAESGNMELNVEQGDVFAFAHQLADNLFLPLTRQKGVRLCCHIPEGNCPAALDFDKADKILYNLMSNAVKYTPEGKCIGFTVEVRSLDGKPQACFSVRDEGPGIPHKEQSRIFERFYTGSNGKGRLSHGIGLALSRELAALHQGSLTVESEPGKGSCFTLSLPIGLPYREPDLPSMPEAEDLQERPEEERPVVLLVDDHADLPRLMAKVLSPAYRILTAANGQEALALLARQEADLIVSDVMMPVMDGLELCRRLKADLATSHIPVIMLTAKQSAEDRAECYEAGADGYLSKPFELKVLAARIDNLLRSRKDRQQAFRKEDRVRLAELDYSSGDTRFLQDMADHIHAHLAEESFGLEQLAAALNVSKSTLHRKVKAMTGLTPLDFIRNIKLKYACAMLSRHDRTIAEVAYATGFSTPKYFTKCFKEEFGMTPTAYQQSRQPEGTVPEMPHEG